MNRRGKAYHSLESLKKHGYSVQAVKDWRTREFEAGNPSELEDFYRAHDLCIECRGNGNRLLGCRWRDAKGNEQKRLLGKGVTVASLYELYLKDAKEWGYLLKPCDACGGTGKRKSS